MSTERMFLAIPIEDRLRLRLQELQEISLETLRDHGITDVRPENLRNSHITVRFLGDVENSASLIRVLDDQTILAKQFNFCINSINVFDSPRKARVLWAGVDQQDHLRALRKEIDALIEPIGFEEEKKVYSPHLTLARFREPQDIRGASPS